MNWRKIAKKISHKSKRWKDFRNILIMLSIDKKGVHFLSIALSVKIV